jgi:predicted ester cyclase
MDRRRREHRAVGGRAATGRHARFSGVNVFRFEGGKVVELWVATTSG